jgi:hypothetical protein
MCTCALFNLNMRTPSDSDHIKPTVQSALYRSTLLLPHSRFLWISLPEESLCHPQNSSKHNPSCGPGSSVGIATEERNGRSGDRIPVGTRFSAHLDRPWGPPSLLYNGYRVFPGGKERPGRDADPLPPYSAVAKKV